MSGPSSPLTLAAVQRWFQTVVTHPEGVEAGAASEEARALLGDSAGGVGGVGGVITPSAALGAAERLGVYANAYYARLLECLGSVYPVLKRVLGEEVFDDFAFDYLQRHPSRSYTLHELGRSFAGHLDRSRPERAEGGAPDWADFIIDLARLEWVIFEVFDGPGLEDAPAWSAQSLALASPADWPRLRLHPAPCLRLLETRFPVNAFYTEIRKTTEGAPEEPAPAPSFTAVSRRDYVVRRFTLSRTQFVLLEQILAGRPLGEAIEAAFAEAGPEEDEAIARQLRSWFGIWAAEPIFCGFDLTP